MEENEERKLTESEKVRLEAFNERISALERSGYAVTDLTVSPDKANILGTLCGFLTVLPFIVLYFLTNPAPLAWEKRGFLQTIGLIIVYFLLIIVHELIHGLTWSFITENGWKSISFGVIWRSLNPYCTCNEALSKVQYLAGLLMPWFILGIIPCIAAIFLRSGYLMIAGVIMALSAGGDLLLAWMILGRKGSGKTLYLDHPTKIGLVCLEKGPQADRLL